MTRTDRLEHTHRLRCTDCGAEGFEELGGETERRAEAGEPVSLPCARCGADTPHEAVRP